jgi:hypothetical protein
MRLRTGSPAREVRTAVERAEPPHLPAQLTDSMHALVAAAAAVKLDAGSAVRTMVKDEDWQREAWRQLDLSGELRFAANRHAAALSQVRLYVAELDDNGHPGEEAKDPKIQALAGTIFGGPAAKTESLRTMGLQFYIGGESFIVAEGATDPKSDVWYVVSANQIRKKAGSGYEVKRPSEHGGGWHLLDPNKDLLVRSWTPHPRDNDLADSPVRSALPILREIERLAMMTMSQIDSRLISAGVMAFPRGSSFPKPDGTPGTVNDLMSMVLEVAKAQLTGAGTAAGLVPIMIEIPAEAGQAPIHLTFSTPLTAELAQKLDQALKRLAVALDIAPEELLGLGDSNHWSAWSIDETGIKLFIQPVMIRICHALTIGYLRPALEALGVADSEKYTLWFDASPLTVRPNRFEDAVALQEKGIVNDAEVRKAGNFSDESAPTKQELTALRAWEAVKLDPSLLQQKAYADLLGLPVSEPPQPPAPPGLGPDGQPVDAAAGRDAAIQQQLGLPQTPSDGKSPAQKGLAAAAGWGAPSPTDYLLPGAEQIVLRAFELAGARMLTGKGRANRRGDFSDVPKHLLHTRIQPTDREHARRLVDGAFAHAPALVDHFAAYGFRADDVTRLLEGYAVELLMRGFAHEPSMLRAYIERAMEVMLRATPAAA